MKKIILTLGLGMITLGALSCNSQNNASTTAKNENLSVYKLKGEWKITSVDYDSKKFKIKPFDEGADAQCFVGSIWKLIPNNNSGNYSLTGSSGCPNFTQPIKFEVTKDNQFKFKKLEQNIKAKHTVEGYVLELQNQQINSFTLAQSIAFEGEILKVYYRFERIITK